MSFHHYMRGMEAGSRVVARHGEALTNEQLQAAAPSIFATEAHESRSERFAVVPTITVLDGLRAEGFEPFSAVQARTRVEGKAEYTKHMLRLRHRSLASVEGDAEAEGKQAPVEPDALLRPRRSSDRATDLWTAFNVVQENTIKGGLRGRVLDANGRTARRTTREVAGIDQNRNLNRALWMLTERMAQIKAAA